MSRALIFILLNDKLFSLGDELQVTQKYRTKSGRYLFYQKVSDNSVKKN